MRKAEGRVFDKYPLDSPLYDGCVDVDFVGADQQFIFPSHKCCRPVYFCPGT